MLNTAAFLWRIMRCCLKSGVVKVDSIEDAMAAMKAQMGVSDTDMADALLDIVDIFAVHDDGDDSN